MKRKCTQKNEDLYFLHRRNKAVERNKNRKAGNFLIGPEILPNGPIDCISHYLARKDGTRDFFQLKILTLDKNDTDKNTLQGKILLHSEYQLLSLLKDVDSVQNCYELFSDFAMEERTTDIPSAANIQVYTGKKKRRIILVLDNYHPNEFCEESLAYINLQQYVTKHKIPEKEALNIFYEIIKVVEILHNRNIIHRDLKLNNIVLDKRTNKVILTNFCLGKHLNSEHDNLHDQRGSPAYISPDVLTGNYKGKPSDIWSCGVILYTMIFSHFPFIENTTTGLFKKIRTADYVIPTDVRVSEETKKLIKNLLTLNPEDRLTASEVRYNLEDMQRKYHDLIKESHATDDQVVPEFEKNVAADEPKRTLIDGPKFELSTEQASLMLELYPPQSNPKENKTFLKPSTLTNVPVRRFQLDSHYMSPRENNMYGNINSARSLTRQINNLTVRGRINSMLRNTSWHNRIFPVNTPRNVYEVQVREVSANVRSMSASIFELDQRQISNALWSANMENVIQQLNVNRQQLPNCDIQHIVPIASAQGANPTNSTNYDNAIMQIFILLHRLYGNGEIMNVSEPEEFTGIITTSFAETISRWMRSKFSRNQLIQDIFYRREIYSSEVVMVQEFFRKIGVQLELVNGVVKVKKEQHNHLLLVLTYFLQLAGFTNSYFLNIVP